MRFAHACAILVIGTACILSVPLQSAEPEAKPQEKNFRGNYLYYGKGLGDTSMPTASDKKLAISVDGAFAREIFNALGAKNEKKPTCGDLPYRERTKGDISCTLFGTSEYTCSFGLNLITGKSMNGGIC